VALRGTPDGSWILLDSLDPAPVRVASPDQLMVQGTVYVLRQVLHVDQVLPTALRSTPPEQGGATAATVAEQSGRLGC
jgi:hypothetical protein